MDGVDYEAGGSLWTAAFCIANFNTEVRHTVSYFMIG